MPWKTVAWGELQSNTCLAGLCWLFFLPLSVKEAPREKCLHHFKMFRVWEKVAEKDTKFCISREIYWNHAFPRGSQSFPACCSLTCWDAHEQVGHVGVERVNVAQRLGAYHHAGEGHIWIDGCVFSSRSYTWTPPGQRSLTKQRHYYQLL